MQYVTITSSPWFVVDALEMFPNLLRLKKTGSACLALLTGFEKDNFDDGAWGGMPVPGNWELNGSLAQIFLNLGSARARSIYAVVRHDTDMIVLYVQRCLKLEVRLSYLHQCPLAEF